MKTAARRWNSVSLGDVARIERAAIQPDEIEPGTLFVGLENLTSDGDAAVHVVSD